MFSSEIKQTVFVATSLIIASIILGIIALAINLRGDLATVRNQEISANLQLRAYREFNTYNDKRDVEVEEVVALITKYYDSGIDIYINAHGDEILIKDGKIIVNGNDETIPPPNRPSYKDVVYWSGGYLDESSYEEVVKINGKLEDNMRNKDKYWIGVVYDLQDVKSIGGPSDVSGEYFTDVTGIVILEASVAY